MSDVIQLLADDEAQRPYWEQYNRLREALKKTKAVLTALGVKSFPDDQPPVDGAEPPKKKRPLPAPAEPQTVTDLVREACKSIKTGITRDGVLTYLQGKYPDREFNRASVGTLLSAAMHEDHIITLTEKGQGGQPNKYHLVEK